MVLEVLSVPLSVVKVNLNDIIDNEYFLEPVFWEGNSVQWNVYFGSAGDFHERKKTTEALQSRKSAILGTDLDLLSRILRKVPAHLDLV